MVGIDTCSSSSSDYYLDHFEIQEIINIDLSGGIIVFFTNDPDELISLLSHHRRLLVDAVYRIVSFLSTSGFKPLLIGISVPFIYRSFSRISLILCRLIR